MALILNPTIHTAVALDGLPRIASYDDGVDRVLFLVGEIVQSVEASAWQGALPTDPTPQQIAAAILARETEQTAAGVRRAATRLRARGHVAVGVAVDSLTTPQLLSLVRALAYHAGALDDDGVVLPLEEWDT